MEFEAVAGRSVRKQAFIIHHFHEMSCDGRCRIDDCDAASRSQFCSDFTYCRGKERIVGAAEDYSVCSCGEKGGDAFAHSGLRFRPIGLAAFDQLHESLTDMLDDLHTFAVLPARVPVFLCLQRPCCGQHSDDSCSCGGNSRLHSRFHSDERHVVFFTQSRNGCRCSGIACHDDDVRSALHQEFRDPSCASDDVFPALLPVRAVSIVREIDVLLPGEHLAYLPEDGQPANSRIKYPDHTFSDKAMQR